jgi:hypothetical protein
MMLALRRSRHGQHCVATDDSPVGYAESTAGPHDVDQHDVLHGWSQLGELEADCGGGDWRAVSVVIGGLGSSSVAASRGGEVEEFDGFEV